MKPFEKESHKKSLFHCYANYNTDTFSEQDATQILTK